jgi:SH3-like domain-containing protein
MAQAPKVLKITQPAKVYPDPDRDSPALGQAPPGAEAAVLKQVGDWYKVKVAGLTGWLPRAALQGGVAGLLHGAPVSEGGSEDVLMGVYGKKTGPPGPPRDEYPMAMAEKAPSATARPEASMAQKAPPPAPSPAPRPERALQRPQALYPEPDETAAPVARLPAGAKVSPVMQVGDWLKVRCQGRTGWVPATALQE